MDKKDKKDKIDKVDKIDKTKAEYIAGTVSIIVNSILFVAKIWVSIMTASIALAADAWHTLSDSMSSVIVVVAAKLSSKKADKEHPFGHGRWEHIASLLIAVILGIIAYDFFRNSIEQFNKRDKVEYGFAAIIVTIVSIVVKELLAQYSFFAARKTGSSSIKADGWHHRSDALSSAAVLVGILFAGQFWWIDSVLGAIIALMLFYATFKILKGVITKLLGEEPSQELVKNITDEVMGIYGNDLQVHHFHIHDYIAQKELSLHIRVKKDLTVEAGHKIATEIEDILRDKYGMTATIHIEPLEK
ncbi:MAG: cation diffusion facilitator family transporter [Oscillospiraceae bacterium]|nr:cation diffusion facilitator family transporter [Oscillospiraceae bacterium]MCL2159889.1 cation diffusion facilitator family transporter [Oscillospiraceae bacterium]